MSNIKVNKNVGLMFIGLILIALSIGQISRAQSGLKIINLKTSNPPVTVIMPSGTDGSTRPTILIAHGFAGSSILMRGFALTLAHAGYTTVSWDFEGHGANPYPLNFSSDSNDLLKDAEAALSIASSAGLAGTKHVAILGHSMGSGVALSYGVEHPETAATIAISPVNREVTSTLPHNLLLMSGGLEPQFAYSARRRLSSAGGEGGDPSSGTARHLEIIPNVEHISILFSLKAQFLARSWMDQTFGSQPGATTYVDRRIVWFIIGIVGFILLYNTLINLLSHPTTNQWTVARSWVKLASMLVGALAASILLWLMSLGGIQIAHFFRMLVGGYLIIWFGLAGMIALVILRPHINAPHIQELLIGLLALAALWLGVGLLGNFVWLPWLLIPRRLLLWIPGSIIMLPWFFAIANITTSTKPLNKISWWVIESVSILLALIFAINLNQELGFLFIILPLVPVMIGLHQLVISSRHGTWAYSISGAMFTAWLILAVFPLE